jgi:hypothetical protein
MGFARQILLAALALSVAAYASDCGGMTTPEQVMQCCNSMRRSSHHSHRNEECCKTMPAMHSVLGQSLSAQDVSFSPVAIELVRAFTDFQIMEFFGSIIVGHSHDPPLSCLTPVPSLCI